MVHNPPTYFSHDAPKYCRVCGAKLKATTLSNGFDEKTGKEILTNALICSVSGSAHGESGEITSSGKEKLTFWEFLFGK